MKLFIAIVLLFAIKVSANEQSPDQNEQIETSEYLYTSGQYTGFCDGGGMSWFCIDQLKQKANEDAVRQAEFRCSMNHGKLDRFSASCNGYCNPFSIPQGQHSQFVSCNSNCSTRCELNNPAIVNEFEESN